MLNLKNFFTNLFSNLYQNHFKKSLVATVVILVSVFVILKGDGKVVDVGSVKVGNIKEVLVASGAVEASQDSALSFEKSGRISGVNVKVGDKVSAGTVLASLSSGTESAGLLSARASLAQAEANLQDAKNGATQAEINIKENSLQSAKLNLANANEAAQDTMRNANATINEVVKNKLGNIFSFNSTSYKLNYNLCDQNLSSAVELSRNNLSKTLNEFQNTSGSFVLTQDDAVNNKNIDAAGTLASLAVKSTSLLLDDLATLFTSSCAINDTSLATERRNITDAKSLISQVSTNLNTAKSQILSYRNALSQATLSLEQIKAGATAERLKSLNALVDAARASLLNASAANAKNFLIAPFDGVVTEVSLNLGEISSPNMPVIKMMSASDFEIKVKLTEIDAVKIKVGDKASITLDTFGKGVEFAGSVSQVDPAATVVSGVSSYYAKVSFVNQDERVRSGMNAEAKVTTKEKENVNYLQAKYVNIKDGIAKVKVIKNIKKIKSLTSKDDDENVELRKIEIGIRGSEGEVEVVSGITSEDKLLPFGAEILIDEKLSTSAMDKSVNERRGEMEKR